MRNTISKTRIDEIVEEILKQKEIKKSAEDYIDGAKQEINDFMLENKLTEFKAKTGTIKISDSLRKGLDKEKVQSEIVKINDKKIDHIDMNELYKESDVHIVSIKENKEGK